MFTADFRIAVEAEYRRRRLITEAEQFRLARLARAGRRAARHAAKPPDLPPRRERSSRGAATGAETVGGPCHDGLHGASGGGHRAGRAAA